KRSGAPRSGQLRLKDAERGVWSGRLNHEWGKPIMLTIPTSLRVFAHRFATDMRKSFHGLVGIIESELGQQVESGHLFLFFNRRRDRVKILFFTGDGLMILYRLLERGTFENRQAVARHDARKCGADEVRR